jgi:hypothetical protein
MEDNIIQLPDPEKPKLVVGISASFIPQPNITAYEFSILFPYLLGSPLTEADWNGLGPITRHLIRK